LKSTGIPRNFVTAYEIRIMGSGGFVCCLGV
jgi:hypothetical protein